MENIVKNNEAVLVLKDLFKMGKSSLSFNKWYEILKSNKQPEKEIASVINVAKENTYNEDKIFKAVNAIYDEEKDLVEMYKVPEILCNKEFTHVLTKKSVQFMDLTSFLLYTAVECEEDMGFLLENEYHEGNFDNFQYATGEDVWKTLEKLIGMDYKTMEKEFKSVRWEDNENTAIVSFKNDNKDYAILRM
ncbi:hypothetical protein [Clostridium botulinum]|uniref:hypothetical protein n=1 Tax=Clostridium botulinum TaxID=1491 RepID=UPI001C9A77D3|nr:hypothetical protein [Clostridium botulinum]MBY6929780.1 hypothetical protein [Clostridium botulinum]